MIGVSSADEATIVMLRKRGIGSPEIARRCGVTRREVNRIMRKHARESRQKEER